APALPRGVLRHHPGRSTLREPDRRRPVVAREPEPIARELARGPLERALDPGEDASRTAEIAGVELEELAGRHGARLRVEARLALAPSGASGRCTYRSRARGGRPGREEGPPPATISSRGPRRRRLPPGPLQTPGAHRSTLDRAPSAAWEERGDWPLEGSRTRE